MKHDKLRLFANATAVNPLPESVRYQSSKLPFIISLPTVNDLVPVASVYTEPFSLTHPNISLSITGTVLPISPNVSSTVAALVANYVSLRDTDIIISSSLFPGLDVGAVFPAKRPKPQILQDVTIHDMKIMPSSSGNTMLASGTIFARAVLPKGIEVGLNVTKVLPDILVYDGEVPNSERNAPKAGGDKTVVRLPPNRPLPDPLPEKAFAHIRPDGWIPAFSVPVTPGADSGTSVEVIAKIVDVPLQVLPGRDREFRNFVGKVSASSDLCLGCD
jgi:hypothetical protein